MRQREGEQLDGRRWICVISHTVVLAATHSDVQTLVMGKS